MIKSERLKKLENELRDLENWLKLDLVPKRDIEKHKLEMKAIHAKIEEDNQRLRFLKENGDLEEYSAPKKSASKQVYEPQSMPDIGAGDEMSDIGVDMESTTYEPDHTTLFDIEEGGEERGSQEYDTDDDPYSDRNRWRRANIVDPEQDNW